MKKANKILLKSQLKHLTGFLISIAVCGILFLIDLQDGTPETFTYLVICIITIVIIVVFVHIQYLYFNTGVKIELIEKEQIIYYCKNGKEKVIKNEDIISIEKYVSFAHASGGRYLLPTDNYHYQKIRLRDGDNVIITSLLFNDFNLFPEKHLVKKRIIAFII